MKLEFNNPDKKNKNETTQKFLKEGSELYLYLWNLRQLIESNEKQFSVDNEDDLNVEIIDKKDSEDVFIDRVKRLEGMDIDEKYSKNYRLCGNTLVLIIGRIEGCDKLIKIVISTFDCGSEHGALDFILPKIPDLHDSCDPIHQDLQSQLLLIVEKMKEIKCPLPDELQLVYGVMHHRDRMGQCVKIRAFLTKDDAIDLSGDDMDWEGKYGSYEKHYIVNVESSVYLENTLAVSGCKHEVLCGLVES